MVGKLVGWTVVLYCLPSHSCFCILLQRVTATSRNVNIADRMWARLMSSTNQPNFSRYNKVMQNIRKQNALKQAENGESVAADQKANAPASPSSNGFSKAVSH